MPNGQIWIITSVRGGNDRTKLQGCRIEGLDNGYNIQGPQMVGVLASSTSTSPPITFRFNNYQGSNWTVTINNLTPRPSGSWSNNDVNLEGEIGTWETGVGEDEGEDEEDGEDAEGDHSAT